MAILLATEEPRGSGEANPLQHVRNLMVSRSIDCNFLRCSVRFAPPLVILEEDLRKAIAIIGQCLTDLDQVSALYSESIPCDETLDFSLTTSQEKSRARRGSRKCLTTDRLINDAAWVKR
jgi:hypothetical protein